MIWPSLTALLSPLLSLALLAFIALRLRTYLQFYQQEEYDFLRFLVWIKEALAFDRWASAGLVAAAPAAFLSPLLALAAATGWLIYRTVQEPNPTLTGKKTLVLTPRAKRLWGLATALMALASLGLFFLPPLFQIPAALLLIQLVPLSLGLANLFLKPFQLYQNKIYLAQATSTLARLNPTVISISGAFGKTSTKYFLGHILSAHAPTLISPGSTNTPLGLARVVRENLQPHHTYFLAEMGAYKQGSIAHICQLFPPHACATTAIGAAHFERFKSLEAVAKAEFEVLDATLARGGLAVLSIDCIPENLWRPRLQAAPSIKLVTANKEWARPNDYLIKLAKQTPAGLQMAIEHKGILTAFSTHLFGATMAPNLATAFALATELGIPKQTSAAALSTVQPAPHRLVVRNEGQSTLIDDSYNSNPEGFKTALETLNLIGGAKGTPNARRKILVTPGMVELGTLHDAEHTKVGTLAAQLADIILAVKPSRIPTFTQAVLEAKTFENPVTLIPCSSLNEAREWLQKNGAAGDVVLLENDLPDRYEATWKL